MISTKQNGYQPNPCGIENPVPPKTGSNVDFALYHKKQLIRFCKKFHKDCYRLIGQKMALKDKVAELEQKLEQIEKDLADYQFNYPKIKELEKENAELKEKVENLQKYLDTQNSYRECAETWLKLAKAKEIIREIMKYDIPTLDYEKAEQFLKEI